MPKLRNFWSAFVGVALAIMSAPAAAFACPSCYAASGSGSLRAYYISTAILTTMPFLLIGSIGAIFYSARRRRSGAIDADSQ